MENAEIYGFNIMVEAKTRALVVMTRKIHSDWTDKQIAEFLKRAIDLAIEKE